MKFIFSLGSINKRLSLPFLLTLTEVIINVYEYLYTLHEIKTNQIMFSVGIGLGTMSSIFIPCIVKYKKAKDEKICSKKNMKYMSILIVINLVYYAIFSVSSLSSGNDINDPHVQSMFSREALEIIIVTIITFIFLKYKYYIHNILSLIIFCIFSIIIDVILDNYTQGFLKLGIKNISLDLLVVICELVSFCYQTYLMNNKYYNYWTISFILGTIIFIMNIGALAAALIFGNPNGDPKNLLNNFLIFIKNCNVGFVILRIFLTFIFKGFMLQLFRVLILDYLSPNHILICYEITRILITLTNSKLENRWYSLIPFVFQFLSLMFFLEILEYNFCSLNKNTKKNIQKREKVDMIERESVSSQDIGFDIGQGYLINKKDGQNEREMKELATESNFIDNIEEEIN